MCGNSVGEIVVAKLRVKIGAGKIYSSEQLTKLIDNINEALAEGCTLIVVKVKPKRRRRKSKK